MERVSISAKHSAENVRFLEGWGREFQPYPISDSALVELCVSISGLKERGNVSALDKFEQDREDMAVNERNYLGPDDEPKQCWCSDLYENSAPDLCPKHGTEPSEFLDKMTRQDIHRVVLIEQERQAWELVKAVEETLRQANDRWERITAELNALGGEPC